MVGGSSGHRRPLGGFICVVERRTFLVEHRSAVPLPTTPRFQVVCCTELARMGSSGAGTAFGVF